MFWLPNKQILPDKRSWINFLVTSIKWRWLKYGAQWSRFKLLCAVGDTLIHSLVREKSFTIISKHDSRYLRSKENRDKNKLLPKATVEQHPQHTSAFGTKQVELALNLFANWTELVSISPSKVLKSSPVLLQQNIRQFWHSSNRILAATFASIFAAKQEYTC